MLLTPEQRSQEITAYCKRYLLLPKGSVISKAIEACIQAAESPNSLVRVTFKIIDLEIIEYCTNFLNNKNLLDIKKTEEVVRLSNLSNEKHLPFSSSVLELLNGSAIEFVLETEKKVVISMK